MEACTSWDSVNVFDGWIPQSQAAEVEKITVLYHRSADTYYVTRKDNVLSSAATAPHNIVGKWFLPLCENKADHQPCEDGRLCKQVHVADPVKLEKLRDNNALEDSFFAIGGRGVVHLNICDTQETLGLLLTNFLIQKKKLKSVMPEVCSKFTGSVRQHSSALSTPELRDPNMKKFADTVGNSSRSGGSLSSQAGVSCSPARRSHVDPLDSPEFGRLVSFAETCEAGYTCSKIHVIRDPADIFTSPENNSRAIAMDDWSTPVEEALAQMGPASPTAGFPGGRARIKELTTLLELNGISTLGDLHMLTTDIFEAMMLNAGHLHEFWGILHFMRTFEAHMPLVLAVKVFPNSVFGSLGSRRDEVEEAMERVASAGVLTVGQLAKLKTKTLHSLPVPAMILNVLQLIRNRVESETKQAIYGALSLSTLREEDSVLYTIAKEVLAFHSKAHASWRKNDAERPVVTSAMTYVDEEQCKCLQVRPVSSSRNLLHPGQSPMKHPLTPPGTPNHAHGRGSTGVGYVKQWCDCPRRWKTAVNYELSTPSGSRCSEQNVLGQLASDGVPTSAVREVFVHGGLHNHKDPNPLFPCGVCENMLRRVNKDVSKFHNGGSILLFMFDHYRDATRLISMPITEISNREGEGFRRFLSEYDD